MNKKDKTSFIYARGVLALYAKAPLLGKVKTRMQGVLGIEGALSLHKALISYTFCNLEDAQLCPVQLWVAGSQASTEYDAKDDEYFVSICNKRNIHNQVGVDLGARMAFTARQALTSSDYVVIVGSDCPSVNADYLERALQALESGEQIVFGPAEDGGYVLLGLRIVPDCLFASVPWGEADVMNRTRQNLAAAGFDWFELEPRWDVDRPEDLARMASLEPPFPAY